MKSGHVECCGAIGLAGILGGRGNSWGGCQGSYPFQTSFLWWSHTFGCLGSVNCRYGCVAWMGLCCVISRGLWLSCTMMCPPYMKMWNFSNPKYSERHSLLMFTYCISISVRVLLAKAMGQSFWTRVVPKAYSLARVCTMTGCVLSQYVRVVFSSMKHIQDSRQWKVA